MKLQVLGVKRMKGIAKATGNEYDMCSLFALAPVETVRNANMQISGFGYEAAEMRLDPQIIDRFEKMRFPVMLTLETDARAYMGKIESVVVGFTQESNVKAAVS